MTFGRYKNVLCHFTNAIISVLINVEEYDMGN